MTPIEKICTKCGSLKDLSEFNNQKAGRYGKRATCRECQNAENRVYKKTERGIKLRREWKKSSIGREGSRRYRENNGDKIREHWKTDEYRISHMRSTDKQRFGGNRLKALERDNHKCVECASDYLLQVHHLDEMGRNKDRRIRNNNLDNLVTLCARCHLLKHNPVLKRWGKA